MKYESLLELMKERRTIRKFRSDELPAGTVENILEAARLAPSGFNSQPWEAVVVTDPDLKDDLVRIIQGKDEGPVSRNGFAGAPAFILLYGDSRLRSWGPGLVRDDRTWDYLFTASLAAAFEHMHLAAASLGLGAMWVTASRLNGADERIKERLGLPDYLVPFELLALGYPDHTPPEKKLRSLDSMVRYNEGGAGSFRTPEEIDAYFGRKGKE